jgi:hypothetical protein
MSDTNHLQLPQTENTPDNDNDNDDDNQITNEHEINNIGDAKNAEKKRKSFQPIIEQSKDGGYGWIVLFAAFVS